MINGGIYRPTELMRAAARRGWQVTAISRPLDDQPSAAGLELARSIPRAVHLVQFEPPPPSDRSSYFSARISGGMENAQAIVEAARRQFDGNRPSAVMASGPPFAEFVAALVLSRSWQVPLVLDYRDEWTQCPFPFVGLGNVDRFWERRCLSYAELVFFTTASQRAHQLAHFPQLTPERAVVAPNGWHEPAQRLDRQEAVLPPGRRVISFVGLLGEHCDLDEFLETLEQAVLLEPSIPSRILLAFVGTKTPTDRNRLRNSRVASMLLDIDHVPLSQAQAIMQESAALILFNPPRLARYLPGKAYDYIVARQRILVYGEGGELEGLLSGYPLANVVNRSDPAALAQALTRIGTSDQGDQLVDEEFIDRLSRARSAEKQIATIEALLSRPVSPGAA